MKSALPDPSRERMIRRAAIGLGVAFLVFVVLSAEFVLRQVYAKKDEEIRQGMKLLSSPLYASIGIPGSEGVHRAPEFSVRLRANRLGFRDHDLQPGETIDIAFLGDSYVWGTGVEESERFTNRLQAAFPTLRIANFGLCTAGTLNELLIWRDFVKPRRPKIVFLVFFPNDIQNNSWWMSDLRNTLVMREAIESAIEVRRQRPATWPDGEAIVLKGPHDSAFVHFLRTTIHQAIQNVKKRYFPETEQVALNHGAGMVRIGSEIARGNSNWAPAVDLPLPAVEQSWVITETALHMIFDEANAIGARLIVVYLPYQERIHPAHWAQRKQMYAIVIPDAALDFDLPRNRLRSISGKLGAEFLDLTPSLLAAARSSDAAFYYLVDGHLTPQGHRVVFETLKQWLSRNS